MRCRNQGPWSLFKLSLRCVLSFIHALHMKIVLAYSGGLDTSVLLSWIKEKYQAEMIAFCANIGQGEELRGLAAKAKKTGASMVYIEDLQEEFARAYVFPMIQAGAIYESQYF